jgi:hypothetical protein
MLKKEEIIYEEKYSTSYLQLRKSLVLDDFDKIKTHGYRKSTNDFRSMNTLKSLKKDEIREI